MSSTKTFSFSCGYTFQTALIASCIASLNNNTDQYFEPGKIAVISCSGPATQPSTSTLRWCWKCPHPSVASHLTLLLFLPSLTHWHSQPVPPSNKTREQSNWPFTSDILRKQKKRRAGLPAADWYSISNLCLCDRSHSFFSQNASNVWSSSAPFLHLHFVFSTFTFSAWRLSTSWPSCSKIALQFCFSSREPPSFAFL